MRRNLWLRIGLVVAVIVVCVWLLYPPKKTINLGLDLQGGIHLVLGVDVDKAIELAGGAGGRHHRAELEKKGIGVSKIERRGAQRARRSSSSRRRSGQDAAGAGATSATFDSRSPIRRRAGSCSRSSRRRSRQRRELAVRQGLETIRNRVDQFGVAEPTIQQQGDNRILVQLPGVQDPARAKALIGKTAVLEFKLVDDKVDPERGRQKGRAAGRRDPLPAARGQGDQGREREDPTSSRRRSS